MRQPVQVNYSVAILSTPVYDPRPMSWIANIAYLLAGLVYLPVLAYQMIWQRKNRRGWRERLFGPQRRPSREASARRIWVHAVSLGEINAARGIVAELQRRFPAREVAVSTTTDTGYARACELFGPECVFRYPLDFSWAVRRALSRIDPALIVLVELEVWFNLVTLAARRGVPVCVVNGRLTERSCRRFGWLGPLGRAMFRRLRWVGAQDEPTAGRFARVGVSPQRISVTGSVKWDTASVADCVKGQDALAAALGLDSRQPLWVCGSTGVGEEALLLDAFARLRQAGSDVRLAIVPRKPERFNEVADLLVRRGYACVRRSHQPDGVAPATATDAVLLGDTMGELRKFYALATVVFVGRSLVPMGGSDPMEVAALGKPILVGPHMDNFALPTEVLECAGALRRVSSAAQLADAISELLANPDRRVRAGLAAQETVKAQQGATRRTVEALCAIIEPSQV